MQADATALAYAIRTHKLSASEAMQASLNRLAENESLGSVTNFSATKGLQAASDVDLALKSNSAKQTPIFCGVPTLAKDLGGPFKDFPSLAGSNIIPADDNADSILAERFRKTGLCFFGTTTSLEFGLSLASEPAVGPLTRNPLNPELSAGGSSGGAAAAVASGIVSIAHATDAGGSIRVPAACCGLVGLKPSRGAIPGGPNFTNHLGGIATELAICRSVRDMDQIFDAISGNVKGPIPSPEQLPHKEGKLRIGMILETGDQYPTASERVDAVLSAGKSLEVDGHKIIPLDWVNVAHLVEGCARIFSTIITTNLAELKYATGWGFSKTEPITHAAVARGEATSAITLWQLMNQMNFVCRDLWNLFEDFDCLLTPMLASPPKPMGAFPTDHKDIDLHFSRMTAFSPLAALANISGFPAITLPFGKDGNELPLPIQIIAPMGCEKLLLNLAARLESELRWQHKFPIAGLDPELDQ